MKRLILAAGLCALALPARASDAALFPLSDELFHRLLADPRQAQTGVRYYRQGGSDSADVALGNTWGLLRWSDVAGSGWDMQWNVEGMGYSRFHVSGSVNEFQTIDFFANLPLEARRGKWSGRMTLFHQSSHLGDDYIRRTGDTGFRYSTEGLRLVGSYDAYEQLRLYAGGTAFLHSIPAGSDGALQLGFEARTKNLGWIDGRECWAYFAQDMASKGRIGWNVDSNTELGLRLGLPHVVRATRVHIGYYAGHSQFGQFFARKEHYFNLGISFDF